VTHPNSVTSEFGVWPFFKKQKKKRKKQFKPSSKAKTNYIN